MSKPEYVDGDMSEFVSLTSPNECELYVKTGGSIDVRFRK